MMIYMLTCQRTFVLVLCLCVGGGLLTPRPLLAQSPAASATATEAPQTVSVLAEQEARKSQLDQAVAQLIAEARELENYEAPQHAPQFERPHSALSGWDAAQMAPATLERMLGKFTGNIYRDNYVRWHLVWVVQRMLEAEFEKFNQSGEHTIPSDSSANLVRLIKKMPPAIRGKKRPYLRYVPQEIADRYYALIRKTRVQVGFPPFQRDYQGAEALPHMSPSQQEKAKLIIAEADKLKDKFRAVVDSKAMASNHRITQLNLLTREYRGDLIYCLMQTGDPDMLVLVTREIDRQIRKNQRVGLDLISYMYMSAYDGYLSLYDLPLLEKIGRALGKTAQAADEYTEYFQGRKSLPPWVQPRNRHVGEYAFHLMEMLKHPDTTRQFIHGVPMDFAGRERTGLGSKQKYTPENLNIEQVQRAIQLAVGELLHPRRKNRSVLPHYSLRSDHDLWTFYVHGIYSPKRQQILHEVGNHALICWALLASGESYQDPRIFKRINWVLSSAVPYIFDRSMRLLMLSRLALDRWGPAVKRDAMFMGNALSKQGNWEYVNYGEPSVSWGDHANGQYGVLGLWAAQKAGIGIKDGVWARIDRHWRQTQQQTADDAPAGWAMGMFNVDDPDSPDDESALPFHSAISGPMTAGGVATLTLTERNLHGSKRTDLSNANALRHLGKGIAWLDENFTVEDTSADADWFYYMWTMQRVGQATGYRTFNGVDWFRKITAEMLNRQGKDGLWEDPSGNQGKLMSTGFALLYLGNALDPIAISKIRFEGRWNNRPHDLWNFVDYASEIYERSTTWQIVDLDIPLYQLMDSPVLYLTTDRTFELPKASLDRLRQYINAGGLLVTNQENARQPVSTSFAKLAKALFPDKKLQKVKPDHLLYNVHEKLRSAVEMQVIDNGVRPLMVHFRDDIGKGLQANDTGKSESFLALSNLYLFAVGMNPRRVRLENNYVAPQANPQISRRLTVGRVRCGGTFDPEPDALGQLAAILAGEHDVELTIATVTTGELTKQQRLAFLCASGDSTLSGEQAAQLRQWIDGGGTLCIDAAGGSQAAVQASESMVKQIFPQEVLRTLASSDGIISGQNVPGGAHNNRRVKYRYYALRQMGPTSSPRLQVILSDQRPLLIYSPEDLTAGLAGLEHWGIFGYSVESARTLTTNIVLSVLAGTE